MPDAIQEKKQKKKRALGKGLDALLPKGEIPRILNEKRVESITEVDMDRIFPNPFQPREQFDEAHLQEMAASIKEKGLLQPVLIRHHEGNFQLVTGERRLRASKLAGLTRIPVRILHVTDREMLEYTLVENLQREDLNPIEEANAYHKFVQRFGMTQEEIARMVGKNRASVANMMRLLNLSPEIQQDISDGVITPGHARAILSVENQSQRIKLWSKIKKKGLSVRQTEEEAQKISRTFVNNKKATEKPRESHLVTLEASILEKSGLRVKIREKNTTSGKIEIFYQNLDDMDRILSTFGIDENPI